jgi:hypothetical protein
MSSAARPRRRRGGRGGFERSEVIDDRAQRAWDLRVGGQSQREIAAALRVSQSAVCKILRRVGDQVAVEQAAARARAAALVAARNERLYREATDGFTRSQTDETWRRQRQTVAADGSRGPGTVETETHARDGEPRFLEQAGRALEREIQILGLGGRDRRDRGGADADPAAARQRLAGRLARLAAGLRPGPVAGDAE